MTETDLIIFGVLFLAVMLDLLVTATQTAFAKASGARIVGQEEMNGHGHRNLRLLIASSGLKGSLHLALGVLRFVVVGLALLLFVPWETNPSLVKWIAGTLIITGLVIAWLEWITEEQVKQNPEDWVFRLTPVARFIQIIFYPLVWPTVKLTVESNGIELGTAMMTEDELKSLVDAGQQEGVLENEERKMIISIFRLGDTLAREIMIPRIDVMAIEVNTPYDQAVDNLLRTGYSRVPVYEETIDNILGLLYTKDLLKVYREGGQLKSLRDLLRPAYYVPEAKKADELLAEMQARRIHIAIVVDEYGGMAGLVTLEDIVEEIIGEVQDEYDLAEESPYQQIDENEYVFQGRVDLDDFNDVMNSNLPREEADTIGGFIYNRFGRVPTSGESLQISDLILIVEQVSGRRIRKVRAKKTPLETEDQQKEETHVER